MPPVGPKCLQLHALSGCAYPYGKGKVSALNTLLAQDFPGLADVLGELDTTHGDLVEATFVHCIVSFQGHQWSLPASNSSPSQSDGLTSNISANLLQLCGLICKLCCGKQQTIKAHLMSQLTLLTLGGRSGMTSHCSG